MVTGQSNIGEILYFLRKEKGIGQEKLCRGLCSKGNYSKYEYGERIPDRLLLNALVQRMGKSPDKLASVLSRDEYRYLCWKKKALSAVVQEDVKALRMLLQSPEAVGIVVNQDLQKQFLYQLRAIVAELTQEKTEISIEMLRQAVELTLPGILNSGLKQYQISAEEMGILLQLARLWEKGDCRKDAEKLLWEIADYAEQHYDDYETKIKIYPKAVKLLVPLLLKKQRNLEGMLLCRKAIELLRWQGVLYDLAELMEYYLECAEELPATEETVRYGKQLQALRRVYREYGADIYYSECAPVSYSNREIYLIDEVIRRGRTDKSMSQETLSEGICTPETLSRIESGRRAPNPRNFRALMDKLGTRLDYYTGELYTSDFLVLEKKLELEHAISLKNWAEAHRLLEFLKARLDMKHLRNQRIMEAEENCILFNEGKMDLAEFKNACEKALGCEREGWREERFWNQFFTKYKVNLMSDIACICWLNRQADKAIFISEHLMMQLEASKVRPVDRYKSYMTVVANLSSYYGETGRMEECLKICADGIHLCLESGRGMRLGKFIGNKAEALNSKAGELTEESKFYLEQAYYISDLMSVNKTTAYIDKYYRSHYESDISWY